MITPAAVAAFVLAAAALPPTPARHFNDYAPLIGAADAERLDAKLRVFEEESGRQIVVAIFPRLPAGAVLEDFTVRTAESWGVGRRKEDDGAVLFVFVQDRKSRLEVGYGLEDRLPDAIAKRVVQDVLRPHFQQQLYAAGLEAAIDVILAAARGDAPPLPAAPVRPARREEAGLPLLLFVFALIILFNVARRRGRRGWTVTRGGWYDSGGGWGSWGGSSGGGGWSGSDGGGFSGGGGSFGGGGASGDW